MNNLNQFLNKFSKQELEVLQKIIGTKKTAVIDITKAFGKLPLPVGGFFQSPLTYQEVLNKIAKKNGFTLKTTSTTFDKEKDLFQQLFAKEYDQMSPAEKEVFLAKLEQNGLDKSQIASITSIGAIAAAQISGFGIYLLATSTVGAITGALGLTLPFAFYTGMTSAISFAIGPLGLLVMGYFTYKSFKDVKSLEEAKDIFKQSGTEIMNFFGGNMDRVEMAFKYIISMRILKIKLNEDRINEVEENIKKSKANSLSFIKEKELINNKVNEINNDIVVLNKQIEDLNLKSQAKEKEKEELVVKNDENENEINVINGEILTAKRTINEVLDVIKKLKQ